MMFQSIHRLVAYLVVVVAATTSCSSHVEQDDPDLTSKVGVYALTRAGDVPLAAALGVQYVVGQYRPDRRALNAALWTHDMSLVDSLPQRALYDTVCPTGRHSCAPLTDARREAFRLRIREHARAVSEDALVQGFLITDDYRQHVGTYLPVMAEDLREVAPGLPLVCGVAAPLGVIEADGSVTIDTRILERSVQNFSPGWCDYVIVYSYAPTRTDPAPQRVEWRMETLMAQLKSTLRNRGWKPEETPLLGGPQAFEFNPLAPLEGRNSNPLYRGPATRETLQRQTEAFCQHDAVGIVAYAWRAPGVGNVSSLADREDLREGLAAGARDCGFQRR